MTIKEDIVRILHIEHLVNRKSFLQKLFVYQFIEFNLILLLTDSTDRRDRHKRKTEQTEHTKHTK